ncbi:hypothetical protein GCM10011490_13450 [Pseudoclavibacter endophyticus]|nr:hypothetical protein GCM10011490_13450 [Pseudoclavibacter endophyticus]
MDGEPRVFAALPEIDFDAVDFVTSDHHFGHARIIELCDRPFASVAQMDTELVAAWNGVVGPDDTVLHLGDLALGKREEMIRLTESLNGRKLLVPGNHDSISTVYRASAKNKQRTLELLEACGWTVLPEIVGGTRGGRRLIAAHYPYYGDSHGDDRHVDARPVDEGIPLLHGHTHDAATKAHEHMYHVGVDAHEYEPIPMAAIDDWLRGPDAVHAPGPGDAPEAGRA